MTPVDKNVPIPPRERKWDGGQAPKYPWASMDVGDSFYAADKTQKTMAGPIFRAMQKFGRKFIARPEGNGVRIWRVG
jgi:hypothetical protein